MNAYQQLKKRFKRLYHLQYIQRILMWDEAVMMPEGAGKLRADATATLHRARQKMLINQKIKTLIDDAKQQNELTDWDKANLAWMEKEYIQAICVPLTLVEQTTRANMTCEQIWRKMRPENNWRDFFPYLEKSFYLTKEVANRKAEAMGLNPYDALLDAYVPGFNQTSINAIFSELKKYLPALIHAITEKQTSHHTIEPYGPFPILKQEMLGLNIMKALGFDFNYGRLDVSHHPFCSGGPRDVRMTTRYTEAEFLMALFATCHETGHALYEQGLPEQWLDQPVGMVQSMAMHESQSLLIEMQVCCSPYFYEYITPLIRTQFGVQDAFTSQNLYQLATNVSPGFIRVEADEVTYPLHVILRYEIEKALFNNEITIKELPAFWNEWMQTYLGLTTEGNDRLGVMQDVHWPSGAFGYFPAYTLGRLMAAQYFATYKKSHPNYGDAIKQGDFQPLLRWLRENIHSQASLFSTHDLLLHVTHESLNPNYFIEHIKERYL